MPRAQTSMSLIDRLDGSRHAKRRLVQLLALQAGICAAREACRTLGIRRSQLYDLRRRALQAALDALEPRPAGRPSKSTATPDLEHVLQAMRAEVEQLKHELAHTRARARIADLLDARVAEGTPRAAGRAQHARRIRRD